MVVPESSINNIMGGLENTGGVRLHNHKRKLKQRFDIMKKLGQGTYGKVQLGINKETGQEVAIKTIKKCKIETEADLIRIRREIQIMSSVQHPNIIHIYEVFENREKIVLVMEYAAGGELYDYLSERKVLAEEEARRIFRQIATAVYYCHKHKICHRDLKLENILLDENGSAKIADFGLSNVFDDNRLLGTFCGSPLYASPEIVKGIHYHGPEVDCWSLGVLLYTLVYGAMPFDGSNFKRLVRQISQGDYFEPKKPSPASSLIRDMLNVQPSRRADINAICSHSWLDDGESLACLDEAERLANETPVRLELLLCLAPTPDAEKLLVGDQAPGQEGGDRPLRSQSMSSLATSAQPEFLPEAASTRRDPEAKIKRKEEGGSVKRKERSRSRRERSSSRSRRDDSTPEPDSVTEKPKRRSVKSKKSTETKPVDVPKEVELLQPKILEVEEELAKSTETIRAPPTPVDEVPKAKSPVPSDEVVIEDHKAEASEPTTPLAETKPITPPAATPTQPAAAAVPEKSAEIPTEEEKPAKPMERRKSKIFETAEKFNKIAVPDAQPKPQPKKMVLPGVKVSDAKKAYERRSSLASSTNFVRGSSSRKSLSGESSASPPPPDDTKFSLASTVALNKLVENVERLSKMEDEREKEKSLEKTKVEQPNTDSSEKVIKVNKESNENEENKQNNETRTKVKNAVQVKQVIGNAITEGISAEPKAATLPRRKTSRAEIKLAMPASKAAQFHTEVEHKVGTPGSMQRSEVKFPVAAVSPASRPVVRQGSTPREFIVPIQMEQEPGVVKPPAPPSAHTQRSISRTSSKSLSRQSTLDSELGSSASVGEAIRKSPREVIIPIAVEGGGFVTPSADAVSRMSSLNESEDDVPRGFGLHSTRKRPNRRELETADSVSSDEDDDNFEILTAENLFSTLLSRVRSLTQRLNTEDRQTAFPRLFNHHHSIFDIPPRRLTEARSFGRADSVPWRRSVSREGAAHRDGSASRIGLPQRTGSLSTSGQEKPPLYRPSMTRNSSDLLRRQLSSNYVSNSERTTQDPSDLKPVNSVSDALPEIKENCPQEGYKETDIQGLNGQCSNSTARGIPTTEIIGSSVKDLGRSESIKESKSKAYKLPRMTSKTTADDNNLKAESIDSTYNDINFQSKTSQSSALNNSTVQTQPRRNSLERPSYYNSLFKVGQPSYENTKVRLTKPLTTRSQVHDPMSDKSSSTNNEEINRFNRYLSPSKIENAESSLSNYEKYYPRPYSTIGRSLSMRNPVSKIYNTSNTSKMSVLDSDRETKYGRNQTLNISRITGLKESDRYSSKNLRPQSLYGGTEFANYQGLSTIPSTRDDPGKQTNDPSSERFDKKSSLFSRRNPSYQRSVSLLEGNNADDYQYSPQTTPDRSVLGKFLSENEAKKPTINEEQNGKLVSPRKMSRFLRPDFYDTPKENSVYEKKEKIKSSASTNDIWKEKDATPKFRTKKSASKLEHNPTNQEKRLSFVDKAIRSLRDKSTSRIEHESMARESNLIKRAVSLEDCSLVPEHRGRRSTSLTPQTSDEKTKGMKSDKGLFQKKKVEYYKKNIDTNLNSNKKSKELNKPSISIVEKISRKISPKVKDKQVPDKTNGSVSVGESQYGSGVSGQESRSRMSRIAGLKRLEFTRPVVSADSTPSIEESRVSGEPDDSSSILSPTEDGSDTWSISSDYADAREFNTTAENPEESVSERIRRKSFYSRFNQSKRRKSTSQSGQSTGSRSRLPIYTKSVSSDFSKINPANPSRKISDPEKPTERK